MKRSGLVILTLAASVTAACAADVPASAQGTPAYTPVLSPTFNWSGFYLGAMGGYGWSERATFNGITTGNQIKGGLGGGTVGFNYQPVGSMFVVGAEADLAWANLYQTVGVVGVAVVKEHIKSFGSVTGRVGIAADTALFYAKGGYGWMTNEVSATAFAVKIAEAHTHGGWTVGGGVEWAFAGAWSAKGEYMFARYTNQTYMETLAPPGFALGFDVHTVKAGINYRFGWSGPVVAKY